ncbi:MAG: hypothetical protein HDR44_04840 [Allobaculum sp.]|nr:hypothetical protein [Allobaculum sp.]
MKGYKLRLDDPGNGKIYDLALHPLSQKKPLSELLTPPEVKVYFNRRYEILFLGPQVEQVQSLEMQLNGYPIETNFRANSGRIYLNDSFTQKGLFTNSFGLSYFLLKVRLGHKTYTLISDYFQIMVRPGLDTSNVNSMGQFTANHNSKLLYEYQDDILCPHPIGVQHQYSMEDKLRHLKYILYLLEKDLPQVVATSKTIPRQVIGHFQLDAISVQELMRRPDLFTKVPTGQGLRVGFQNVAPDFSKLSPKVESELYEDQVIVSFIREAMEEIPYLRQSIGKISNQLPQLPVLTESQDTQTWISSSSYMTKSMRLTLESMLQDLETIQKKLTRLYTLYQDKLAVHTIPLQTLPLPTPTFLSVSVYRSIYEAMRQWFFMRSVNPADLRFTRSFLQTTTLYEVYVLAKLGECLEDWGFQRIEAHQVHYELEADAFYRNPEINNVFVYQKDDLEITLYYQPVIWEEASGKPCICGLYRTVSLSYSRSWNESIRGRYYTPDYVIRIKRQNWQGARYIIADAKYTHYQDVHDFKIIPLLYKYLFSLGPKNTEDKITGLYIFHGKRQHVLESQTLVHSAYDLVSNGHERFPQVEVISLYEYAGTIQRDQFKMIRDLLEVQIEGGDQEFQEELAIEAKIEERAQILAQELYEEKCKTAVYDGTLLQGLYQQRENLEHSLKERDIPSSRRHPEASKRKKARLEPCTDLKTPLQKQLLYEEWPNKPFPLTRYDFENQVSLQVEVLIRLFIKANRQEQVQEESQVLGLLSESQSDVGLIKDPSPFFPSLRPESKSTPNSPKASPTKEEFTLSTINDQAQNALRGWFNSFSEEPEKLKAEKGESEKEGEV